MKITPPSKPRGHRYALSIATLTFGAVMGCFGASLAEHGPIMYIILISAFVLLAGAVFYAVRWIRDSRTKQD